MKITDAIGKLVKSQQLSLVEGANEENINVSFLAKGLYLIHLVNEKEITTQTILKM